MRVVSVACVLGLGGGCRLFGLGGTLPAREMYRLTLPDTAATVVPRVVPLQGTLAVASYVTPGMYGEPGIVFRVNDSEYGAYPSREWAVPLGEQLGVLTERVLGRNPLSSERAVFDPPSLRAQQYIWRGTIREFEEVNRGNEVLASVRIDARLVRAVDDSIIWSGTARAERKAPAPTMYGIVQTLSELADQVVADLVERARRDISGTGSAALSPAPVQSP